MQACAHKHAHLYPHMHTHAHTHTHKPTHADTHVHTCLQACMHAHAQANILAKGLVPMQPDNARAISIAQCQQQKLTLMAQALCTSDTNKTKPHTIAQHILYKEGASSHPDSCAQSMSTSWADPCGRCADVLRDRPALPLRGSVCPACARRATFVLTIPTLTPDLPSPRESPQIDQSGPQAFPTKHAALGEIVEFNVNACHFSCA